MHGRTIAAGLFVTALVVMPARAFAGPPRSTGGSTDDSPAANVDQLLLDLTREVESLSVADCTLSCKALASMERSRDRICELSPGTRCEDARKKVAAAHEKVAASCPTCMTQDRPQPAPSHDAMATAPEPPPASSGTSVQSEHQRGGCASCRVTGERGGDAAGDGALVIMATLAIRRLARRRRSDH